MVDSGEKEDRTDGLIGCTAQVVHYLKMHGVKQLDFYIATHAHSDHIGNAESILREFPTKKFILENTMMNIFMKRKIDGIISKYMIIL